MAEDDGVAGSSPSGAEPGALGPTAGAPRPLSLDVQDSVERFSDPKLLAAGKVNLISVEAVQLRFGPRWELRKEQVLDFTDRVLARGLGTDGAYLRVSDTDFFVVHPDLSRIAGQAACLRYLREVLTHFLGDAQMAAGGILQVTAIAKGRLDAAPIDAAQAEAEAALDRSAAAEAAPAGVAAVRFDGGDIAAPPRQVNPWTPFVSTDGRQMRVSATLEPVYELKGFTRIGFRMIRRIVVIKTGEDLAPKQVAALSPGDLLKSDMATITRGLGRLKSEADEEHLSLIVPVSFVSLSSQRGRAEVGVPLREAGGLVKLGVICEVLDIDGVPQGVLLAATSVVRPLALLVVGRVAHPTPNTIAALAGAGFHALSFECPPRLSDDQFAAWASMTVAAAKKIAKSVLIFRVDSPQRAAALAALGATHASLLAA